jgi:hypothetical protein
MEDEQSSNLLQQILDLARGTFEAAHYETAFHLLTAAKHYARDQKDEEGLYTVEETALAQGRWINTHAPDSIMSAQSAHHRRGVDLYGMLAREAHTHALIVKQQNRRDQSPPLSWPGDRSKR